MSKQILTPQNEDFPSWYQDVVTKAELADNGPVRGTQMIRPWGFAIWEQMQSQMDDRIKANDAMNVAFPLFIPMEYLEREAEHVDGFSPELAVVTHGGGKELKDPVAVRPTSETLFGEYMSKYVQGYRDLPMLLNQWCNVVRWEMRTRLFLRSSEFIWQEGHTAHETEKDAAEYATNIHHTVYEDFMNNVLACPVLLGRKTDAERFPGATNTMACEAMMKDTKALQMATSHELGQNFAKAFNISFSDNEGKNQFAWTTSWGASTRMVGGVIMSHGDDNGLRLPPNVAPKQVVSIAIKDDPAVMEAVARIDKELIDSGVRHSADTRTDLSFGRRATAWELKGVPIRIEVGPRDLKEGKATVARRDTGEKQSIDVDKIAAIVTQTLPEIQDSMLAEATKFRDDRIADVNTVQEAKEAVQVGFARIRWDVLGVEGEALLAQDAVTVRCLQKADGTLPQAHENDDLIAIVAKSY